MMNKVRHFGFHEDFPDIRGGVPVNHSGNQYNSTRGPLRRACLKKKKKKIMLSNIFIFGLLSKKIHTYFLKLVLKDFHLSGSHFCVRSHFYVELIFH